MTENQIRDPFGSRTAPRGQDQEGDTREGGRLTYKNGKWKKTYKVHKGQEAVLNGEKVYADGEGNWLKYDRDRLTGTITVQKVGEYNNDETRYSELDSETTVLADKRNRAEKIKEVGSSITYKGKTYNVDDPQEYRAYLENMRRNTKGQLSDIRGGKRADEIVKAPVEPTTDETEQLPPPVDARAFTPEYQELYDLGSAHNEQIRNYYESKGRKDLAQWAQANPALAAKEILKGSGQFMAQELLEKRRNDVIQGEFSTASNSQVPDFDPDSANLNFDSERSYNSTKFDPKYVDFSRNNTVPKEVFSVMEQLGI